VFFHLCAAATCIKVGAASVSYSRKNGLPASNSSSIWSDLPRPLTSLLAVCSQQQVGCLMATGISMCKHAW
jgi:hypothetical protein